MSAEDFDGARIKRMLERHFGDDGVPPTVLAAVSLQAWIFNGPGEGRRASVREGKFVKLFVDKKGWEHREDGPEEEAAARALEAACKAGFP